MSTTSTCGRVPPIRSGSSSSSERPCRALTMDFQVGRGRTQDHHRLVLPTPDQGRVPGVVAGFLILLVGGLVFLVHDDHAQVPHRGEQGRTRAHHHLDLAPGRPLVHPAALPRRQPAVDGGHLVAEAGGDAGQGLRASGRFRAAGRWRPAPRPAPSGDDRQIDLGLAAAGHPVQQQGAEGSGHQMVGRPGHRLFLGSGSGPPDRHLRWDDLAEWSCPGPWSPGTAGWNRGTTSPRGRRSSRPASGPGQSFTSDPVLRRQRPGIHPAA